MNTPIRSAPRAQMFTGYAFVGLYVVVLLMFGAIPAGYAIYLAFTTPGGKWAGLHNFFSTGHDFRFLPAFEHVAIYLALWLALLLVLVPLIALMLQTGMERTAPLFRSLFYIPGALVGSASVLVWLIMLDPTSSPWHFMLSWAHLSTFQQVVLPTHLPFIFVAIAFWTGAGTWIVVLNAALNNIPSELIEAASVDGANVWQLAFHVKLPLVRRWLVYMAVLAFAAGTQLFVEPQVVATASGGFVSSTWSPNQLAYYLAFSDGNFNYAAAISVDLLVLGLMVAAVLVFRSKLLEVGSAADGTAQMGTSAVRPRTVRPPAFGGRTPGMRQRNWSASSAWPRVVWLVLMLVFAAFFAVPLIWLLLSSMGFSSFDFLRTWDGIYGFQGHELLRWLANSARYSFGGMVLAVSCAVLAGYGLALTQFRGRKTLLVTTLIVMIMPASALVLPLFLEMNLFKLLGTAWSVALPFGFFPFGAYLSYIFFSTSVPREVLAAARVDGAGEWDVFRRVALPMARPLIALVAFFAFVSNWTSFYLPFAMLYDDRQYPLPVALEYLLSSVPRPELAMATLVAIAPIVIVFVVAQRALAPRDKPRRSSFWVLR